MILVDTSVLSLAFRRRRGTEGEPRAVGVFRQMVLDDAPLAIPGIVFQELLSGVRAQGQFLRLRRLVEGFPLVMADRQHHVSAAGISNTCRRQGITPSTVDCLIAAMAIANGASLFTTDSDFSRMAAHCGLRLVDVERAPERR